VPPAGADAGVAPHKVWVAQTALQAILDEAEDKWPLETGGMLLGYRGDNGDDIVITEVTGPGPKSRHRRYAFTPDGRWQQRQLDRIYAESGRVTGFLGDWHSHPDARPRPSGRDLKTARKVSRRKSSRASHPTTLIIGSDENNELAVATFVLVDDVLRGVPWEPFGQYAQGRR
jgi:integrative and conjugative element protein (TIGR02256 family)